MSQLMNQVEYAAHRGVSKQAVSKKIKAGAIPYESVKGRKLIDPAAADAAWDANSNPSQKRGADPDPIPPAPPPDGTVASAQRQKVQAEAELKVLELRKKRGEVLERSSVEAQVFEIVRMCRDQLLALPSKLAPQVSVETDQVKVFDILEREANFIAQSLAEGLSNKSNEVQARAIFEGSDAH